MLERYLPGRKQVMLAAIIGIALWLVTTDKLAGDVWFWTAAAAVSGGGLFSDLVRARAAK
jgi:hypothetical protein